MFVAICLSELSASTFTTFDNLLPLVSELELTNDIDYCKLHLS